MDDRSKIMDNGSRTGQYLVGINIKVRGMEEGAK